MGCENYRIMMKNDKGRLKRSALPKKAMYVCKWLEWSVTVAEINFRDVSKSRQFSKFEEGRKYFFGSIVLIPLTTCVFQFASWQEFY
jgi:hypothetical protein